MDALEINFNKGKYHVHTFHVDGCHVCVDRGSAAADYTLTILHTNDIHSRVESINKYDSTCNADGEAEGKCFGGMARLKTIIDAERAAMADQNVVVLMQATRSKDRCLYTYKGAAEAEFMEAIGYDAMAVGNHEFDDGPKGLADFVDAFHSPLSAGIWTYPLKLC